MCYKSIKRGLDFIFSLLLIIILSPVFLILYIFVRIFSGSPVFFSQKRVGRDTHLFNMYKFRSMVNNALEFEKKGKNKKNLITPVGKFMRKLNLDELPQSLCILKGDMSFIGFRAPSIDKSEGKIIKEVKRDPLWQDIVSSRPGLTGLGSALHYLNPKKVSKILKKHNIDAKQNNLIDVLNVFYSRNPSFILDLKIIYWTILVELRGITLLFKKNKK